MVDLIIFSNVGVHPLSHWLEPGFRHVCAITRRGPYWAKADWNELVSIEVIGGSPDEVEEYAKSVEPGCTVIRRPVELRRPARGQHGPVGVDDGGERADRGVECGPGCGHDVLQRWVAA